MARPRSAGRLPGRRLSVENPPRPRLARETAGDPLLISPSDKVPEATNPWQGDSGVRRGTYFTAIVFNAGWLDGIEEPPHCSSTSSPIRNDDRLKVLRIPDQTSESYRALHFCERLLATRQVTDLVCFVRTCHGLSDSVHHLWR